MSKKVLIITYYWPPSGGGGVQRWLKFVKYLPEYGWEPIIYTPENPDFEIQDFSFSSDVSSNVKVIKKPIWEPFTFYKKFLGGKPKQGVVVEKKKLGFMDRLAIWIRANVFIPDPRVFWVNPSVRFLKNEIPKMGVDLIITTGPPHSMHLIGLKLKKKLGLRWIADFRDPWSDWDIFDKMNISSWALGRHKKMEKRVLTQCDQVLTVSKRLGQRLSALSGSSNIKVITNGVDEADFEHHEKFVGTKKFTLLYSGLLNELKNPRVIWQALSDLCMEVEGFHEDLEFILAGTVSDSILQDISSFYILDKKVVYKGYVSHEELAKYYAESVVLILMLHDSDNAKWILPAKMFEYIFHGRPIICLGPKDSDAKDILVECEAGETFDFGDKAGVKKYIAHLYAEFKSNGVQSSNNSAYLNYSRKNLTKVLASELDQHKQ